MRAEALMEAAACLLLLLSWGSCLAGIDGEGELRCYCNEAGCVSTGYMCKSPAGSRCYTALQLQGDSTRVTHGCLDSVPSHHRSLCDRGSSRPSSEKQQRQSGGGGEKTAAEGGAGGRRRTSDDGRSEKHREGGGGGGGLGGGSGVGGLPLLICCQEDMCNYIDNIDINSLATLVRGKNGSLLRGLSGNDRGGSSSNSNNDSGGGGGGIIYSKNGSGSRPDEDRDLWFKAAVIAVPIAGGFILVLLVLLAVRMLRTDTQRHRRLIQVRRERSLTKAQLYVTDHFSDVNAAKVGGGDGGGGGGGKGQARCPLVFHPPGKSHTNMRGQKPVVGGGVRLGRGGGGGGQSGGGGGGKSWCRDVSISVDREGRVYEKVQCDGGHHRHPPPHLPTSSVTWGNAPDFATVV